MEEERQVIILNFKRTYGCTILSLKIETYSSCNFTALYRHGMVVPLIPVKNTF